MDYRVLNLENIKSLYNSINMHEREITIQEVSNGYIVQCRGMGAWQQSIAPDMATALSIAKSYLEQPIVTSTNMYPSGSTGGATFSVPGTDVPPSVS